MPNPTTIQLFSEKDQSLLLTLERWHSPIVMSDSHAHQTMEIFFVVQGTGTIQAKDRQLDFTDGDIFVFESMQPHQICTGKSGLPFEAISLRFGLSSFINEDVHIFDRAHLDTFSSRMCNCDHKIHHSHGSAAKIQNLLSDIADCLEDEEEGFRYLVRSMVLLLFARIVQYYNEGFAQADLKKTNHRLDVERTMVYIQQNLTDHIALDTLAQIANMNKNYYSTVFRQVTGSTVWDYILHARVELARRYLLENKAELNITEISRLCGFNSTTNFNKTFKKFTGMTPSEYKNSNQNACFFEE